MPLVLEEAAVVQEIYNSTGRPEVWAEVEMTWVGSKSQVWKIFQMDPSLDFLGYAEKSSA